MSKDKQPKDPAEHGNEIKTAADLKQDGNNYRKHSDANKARIKKSIEEAGLGRSVVIDADGVLVAGNGVQSVIDKDTPVRVVETDGTELVVVKRTDLHTGDPRRKTLALADNATADDVEWDFEAIAEDWTEDEAGDWGVEWPEDEEEGEQKEAHEDDFDPDKPVETVCKKGDIWKLGNHRLMCGDSTSAADVALLFNGEQPYAIMTDPPYCSGGFQESGKIGKRIGSIGTRDTIMIANDTLSTRGYMSLIKEIVEKAGKCAMAYIFTDWRMYVNLFDVMEASGYGVRNMIVWDKITPGMGIGWRMQHEICLFASRAAQPFNPHLAQGNVIQCKRTGNVNHPTEKPVELIGKIIRVTDMAETIYDPFSGSGTTLIACEELGRKCYAMELDPHYCDVIIARWEKLTGNKAEKLK